MITQEACATRPSGLANISFGSGFDALGCKVNNISVEDLFTKYQECGFLYPAKLERLSPYLPLIAENWQRSLTSDRNSFLHHVYVYADPEHSAWASVSFWATSNRSVHSQHLVSTGRPEASRAVLLDAQSALARDQRSACQNWFRSENRFPARVFGSCIDSLGAEVSALADLVVIGIDRSHIPTPPAHMRVHRCSDADRAALSELARQLCGGVQARADEWGNGDIDLNDLDTRFREVGLRRFRRTFIARSPGELDPSGFAVAYRGPLGLNFSFLENRLELWIEPHLTAQQRLDTAITLIQASTDVYETFEAPFLVATCDESTAAALCSCGGRVIQKYRRSTWLGRGFRAWYDHVDGFYTRVLAAAARRPATTATGSAP